MAKRTRTAPESSQANDENPATIPISTALAAVVPEDDHFADAGPEEVARALQTQRMFDELGVDPLVPLFLAMGFPEWCEGHQMKVELRRAANDGGIGFAEEVCFFLMRWHEGGTNRQRQLARLLAKDMDGVRAHCRINSKNIADETRQLSRLGEESPTAQAGFAAYAGMTDGEADTTRRKIEAMRQALCQRAAREPIKSEYARAA